MLIINIKKTYRLRINIIIANTKYKKYEFILLLITL